MGKHLTNIALALVFLIGLCLVLYPTVSDHLNSMNQSRAINVYLDIVDSMDYAEYERLWNEAQEYNVALQSHPHNYTLTDEEQLLYQQTLNIDGNGLMGTIEIPAIDVSLPIYHGTSDVTLQSAVGHVDWSSLPVGGAGSHCVLSGHRGLPSAKLFSDLPRLQLGDTFTLHVLGETLEYEVDQILTVEPYDVSALEIVEGEDYCTLVTCTPYGVNTHRLLVRGRRTTGTSEPVEQSETLEPVRILGDLAPETTRDETLAILIPVALVLLFAALVIKKK